MTAEHQHHRHDHHGASANSAIDPVCGMKVDPHSAKHCADHGGRTYYFCSAGCRTKFVADPQKYLGGRASLQRCPKARSTPARCIRRSGRSAPARCPICGMALEPEIASPDTGPNPELVDMMRRFWIGLVLTLPVFILEMGAHIAGAHNWVEPTPSNCVPFAFATPVVLWAGWPFFVRGWQSLVTRNLNMFTLIAMGTGVAYVYSLAATFVPGIFRRRSAATAARRAVYFEAASVITVLVLMGQVLELRAREADVRRDPRAARPCAQDRAAHRAATAAMRTCRSTPSKSATACACGPATRFRSMAPCSKAAPRSMNPWSPANPCRSPRRRIRACIGGTLNTAGSFIMRADKVGRDTLLSQIVQMVASAQRSRAPIQRLADQVSAWFVPAVIAVALLAFAAWAMFGPEPRFAYRPCGSRQRADHRLPLRARPRDTDVDHGRRRPRRAGRRADQERRGARADGKDRHARRRQDRHADGRQAEGGGGCARARLRRSEVLQLAASIERGSEHPLAAAIVAAAAERKLELLPVRDFDAPAGKGVIGIGRRQAARTGQRQVSWRNEYRHFRARTPKPSACAATVRPLFSSLSTARPPASLPSPIRSKRRRLMRCGRSPPTAFAS